MDVVDFNVPELKALAPRLEALMKRAHTRDERAPLDSLLGALHGLIQAKRLGFKDRSHSLDDPRGRSPQGIEYWDYGPLVRVAFMVKGELRLDGAWTAGFYFDSALARLAAVFDRAVRRKAAQRGLDRKHAGSGRPPNVRVLLRALGLGSFTKGKLAGVYDEVNRLKHHPAGLAEHRRVTMADARNAFEQAIVLLEHPKMR